VPCGQFNVYEAYKRTNGGAEPPNPRQFFRQTLEANYGLQDLDRFVLGHLEQSKDGSVSERHRV
jgi:hypothetical protein